MPRNARIVLPGTPHHVVQRGNRKQRVFFQDSDRRYYINLLSRYVEEFGVAVLAYCLMDNHVHLLLVPCAKDSLHKALKTAHMRYSQHINKRNDWRGHLWQQRFYSSPVSKEYFWIALRYILQNPVKAGIVEHPVEYDWSSAQAQCKMKTDELLNYTKEWKREFARIKNWHDWLAELEDQEKVENLVECTSRDFPCGSADFVEEIEKNTGLQAAPRKRGRPYKLVRNSTQ